MLGLWQKKLRDNNYTDPNNGWEYSEYVPVEPQPSIQDQFQEVLERLDRIEKKIEEMNNGH